MKKMANSKWQMANQTRAPGTIGGSVSIVLLALCHLLFAALPVSAQTPPAGNAHPTTQNIDESGRLLANPFGGHNADLAKAASVEAKAKFAKELNLEPLRDLAVFHNGRIKVLDTLARETVVKVSAKRKYADLIGGTISEGTASGNTYSVTVRPESRVKYDPLFTFLDLVIDPVYYLDKPIIGIDYLPLREQLLEAAYPQDEDTRKRELKSGCITPMVLQKYGGEVAQANMGKEAFARALDQTDEAVHLFVDSSANFEMVAPASRDLPWRHISSLPGDAAARRAALELGQAWRAMDAAKANAAIATLAAELPKLNPAIYPAGRRSLELTYNKVNAFEWGYWAYALSLVTLLLAFGTGRKWLAATGSVMLVAALALHAFGFVSRCILAERFAIQNQFESMTGLSLFGATVGTAIMLARRQWLFGAAAAAVGFMVLITATQTAIPGKDIEREAAILNTSVLLKYHVTTVLCSYSLIALGFVTSLFYLGSHYFGIKTPTATEPGSAGGTLAAVALGDDPSATPRAKLLADLDKAQMIVLQLAFWALGVGILLGAWWADHSWGRWWGFDPKETWALLTWIIYLIVVHVRIASPKNKGLTTAWLSVVGFVMMLWTYFGVNLLLPGLHAYA
jgi:cytochrome c-type biogenesis protein CcsB